MLFNQPWALLTAALCSLTARADIHSSNDPDVKSIPLRTHSLQSPYLDSDMQSRWFDFGGDTIIRSDQYVRLTGELSSRSGYIFSRVPLTATNWEIEVSFKIHGQPGLFGDGMAIWLTKQRAQQGPVFGFIDNFEGLAIFIDTYKNNRPGIIFPYIMAMVGDGLTPYDKHEDGKANDLGGCTAHHIRNVDYPTKLKLTYFHDKSLTVSLKQTEDPDHWEPCFTLPNVKIPPVAYLGFTAESGELFDNHDIISVETNNLYAPESSKAGGNVAGPGANAEGRKKLKDHRKKSGGWGWFFFKFLLFGLIVAGAYAGFTAYRTQRSRSRF